LMPLCQATRVAVVSLSRLIALCFLLARGNVKELAAPPNDQPFYLQNKEGFELRKLACTALERIERCASLFCTHYDGFVPTAQ
jgi:hypothetical protein